MYRGEYLKPELRCQSQRCIFEARTVYSSLLEHESCFLPPPPVSLATGFSAELLKYLFHKTETEYRKFDGLFVIV